MAQDVAFAWLKKHVVSFAANRRHVPDGSGSLPRHRACREPRCARRCRRLEVHAPLRIVGRRGARSAPPITDTVKSQPSCRRAGLVEDFCVRRAVHVGEFLAPELDRLRRAGKQQKSPLEFIELDREFHRAIVRAAQNPVLADFYESLRDRQTRMGCTRSRPPCSGRRRAHRTSGDRGRGAFRRRREAAASMALHLARTLAVLRLPSLNFPGVGFEKAL